MPSVYQQAGWLASSLVVGEWRRDAIAARIERSLVTPRRAGDETPHDKLSAGPLPAVGQLVARLVFHFEDANPPPQATLFRFLRQEPEFQRLFKADLVRALVLDAPVMRAQPQNLLTLPLPALATIDDICRWFDVDHGELHWLADSREQQGLVREQKLHHYRLRYVAKPSGGHRLLEIPKSRLKAIQRKLLRDILGQVPPHPASHGFTRGRSTKSFAAPHVGQNAVLRFDLQDFFPSVPVGRITRLFLTLGYPPAVARILQGLCTTAVSPAIAGRGAEKALTRLPLASQRRVLVKHLPQGAPTSPMLANLCAWRLDCRLAGLARKFDFAYTRYADDFVFSGNKCLASMRDFLEPQVGAIALDEGFALNHRKTRVRLNSQRQRLCGIVVNQTLNGTRFEWDRLKATLHNCVRYGPASQNRDGHPDFRSHLLGRLNYLAWLNPARGEKLHAIWCCIDWESAAVRQ